MRPSSVIPGWRLPRPLAAVALCALTLAPLSMACAQPTVAPADRDRMVLGVNISPATLDPTSNPSEGIRIVTYDNIFEGLTRLDEQGRLQPLLARSWTVSPDGLDYSFTLQPDVTFHDGHAFDCETVRFTLNRAAAPESVNPQKQVFQNIDSVTCPSALEAHVRLRTPHGSFLSELAWDDAAMLSPTSAATNGLHPIGTGPFVFSSWKRGESVTLERNDHYWGQKAKLKTVVFRFFSDPMAAANALMDGQVDAYPSFPAPEMAEHFTTDPRFVVTTGLAPFKGLLALNNRRKPFRDLRVRQALAYALDRAGMAEALDIPGSRVLGSHMSPENKDYTDFSTLYSYDPQKARALLKEAGVEPGTHLRLLLPPIGYARATGELVAAYLEQVGITVSIVQVEWPAWLSQVFGRHDFDMTIIAHTEPDDIGIYARPDYYFGYNSPTFQQQYAAYENTADSTARHNLAVAMQQTLAHDVPNVFLFFIPRTNIIRRNITGLWNNLPLPACPMADVQWRP